ncbi:Nfi-1 [Aphelenchoides besseyi]|nr:Nfi-1 [Aphelenchoides besseyi]
MYLRILSTTISVGILILASIIPYFGLQRVGRNSRNSSLPISNIFNAFASGIFLSTCFLGLMPHLKKNELMLKNLLNETQQGSFSTADIFVDSNLVTLFGFLLIALIEKSIHLCIHTSVPHASANFSTKKRTSTANQEQTTALTAQTDGEPLVNLNSGSESDSDDDFGQIEFRSAVPVSSGHAHHTIVSESSFLQSLVLLFALSIHSIFEGIALGAQSADSSFFKFLVSIMLHEVLCSFAFGVNLANSGISKLHGVFYILFLSFTLPFGIGIMGLLSTGDKVFSTFSKFVMEGIAAGTFIYVACIEMLGETIGHHTSAIQAFWNSLALFAGAVYVIMSEKLFEWDDLEFFNSIYQNSTFAPRSTPYKITSPFRMDSQKHKRKKQPNRCIGPTFLVEETEFVKNSSNILSDNELNETDLTMDNNRVARCFVSESPECSPFQSDNLRSLGEHSISNNEILTPNANDEFCRYTNQQNKPIEVTVNKRKLLIPQQSKFILGEVSAVCQHLMNREELFDIIVVDPPWQNKSVRRKSVYHCGNEENWTDLDVSELLARKGLVCLWLTNGSACRRLADELIRKWSLVVCSEMFWLKITKSGRTVCDFRPNHKVPFEKLLFFVSI